MTFSYRDYQKGLQQGKYLPPDYFKPYFRVNKREFANLEKEFEKNNNTYEKAFQNLRKRVGDEYFKKIYPMQAQTLTYAQNSFPVYRHLLPEILTSDWLAIVDWHKYQRDHSLHQPLTAYIVLKLLTGGGQAKDSLFIEGSSLLDLCVDRIINNNETKYISKYLVNKLGFNEQLLLRDSNGKDNIKRNIWKTLFLESAYIAALFHDMGYPWQFVNSLTSKINKADYFNGSQSLNMGDFLRCFDNRLLFCPFYGYNTVEMFATSACITNISHLLSKSIYKSHGFPGAIGFLYVNDLLNDFPNIKIQPLHQLCIEWAALAIMMHDMGKIYWGDVENNEIPDNPFLRLKFNVDPLSCIIALADVIEEFERPTAAFNPYQKHSKCEYISKCKGTDMSFDEENKLLRIKYIYMDHQSNETKQLHLQEDSKLYFHKSYGYLDLSDLGIDEVTLESGIGKV